MLDAEKIEEKAIAEKVLERSTAMAKLFVEAAQRPSSPPDLSGLLGILLGTVAKELVEIDRKIENLTDCLNAKISPEDRDRLLARYSR